MGESIPKDQHCGDRFEGNYILVILHPAVTGDVSSNLLIET